MQDTDEKEAENTPYGAFLYRKVEAARASVRAGQGRSDEDVEVEFAARRAGIAAYD